MINIIFNLFFYNTFLTVNFNLYTYEKIEFKKSKT